MNQIVNLLNENCVKYNGNEITVVFDSENNPWFKAKEIAEILGYKDTKTAIIDHVTDKYKCSYIEINRGGVSPPRLNIQNHTVFISEPGLYSLIMSSKLEAAIKFQDWVFEEVLPSIRKYGQYKLEAANRQLTTQVEALTNAIDYWKGQAVIPTKNDCKHHRFVLIKKNHLWEYPYYALRVQKCNMKTRIKEILIEYPEAEILLQLTDGNTINLYNRMKEEFSCMLWQGNHFTVDLCEVFLMREILDLHLKDY